MYTKSIKNSSKKRTYIAIVSIDINKHMNKLVNMVIFISVIKLIIKIIIIVINTLK